MSRPPHTQSHQPLSAEIREYRAVLDASARQSLGVSGRMYRALDRLFNILVLAATIWLIQYAAVEPMVGMVFAVLLIGGAEYVQTFMIAAATTDRDRTRGDD